MLEHLPFTPILLSGLMGEPTTTRQTPVQRLGRIRRGDRCFGRIRYDHHVLCSGYHHAHSGRYRIYLKSLHKPLSSNTRVPGLLVSVLSVARITSADPTARSRWHQAALRFSARNVSSEAIHQAC